MTAQELISTGLFKKPFTAAQLHSIQVLDNAWATMGDIFRQHQSYLYATIYHEVAGTMLPIKESGSDKYLKSKKYWPYIGYGYIQLTGKGNFKRVGGLIGVDLIAHPEKALEPEIAAEIAVKGMIAGWFTGKRLHDYINQNGCDYIQARRIINGVRKGETLPDKATLIAGYAVRFEKALS